ncbi:small, acid-soluble spore protein, alpha/beta type [Paenibacillus sp. GCM10027627]|uniref:small, acid-soluble spore protein, alpha/beta type n=1 Tax=unclassified Paenibacillus TaxID=185978 RepID=UPI00363CA7BC
MSRNSSNQLIVPQARVALEQLKYEIAQEHGIQLSQGYNGDLTTREAGTIGGNITRRLVQIAEQQLSGNQRF